jgi:transcriptional regulator with XRE-family HTH domain
MPSVKKPERARTRHFMRQWREFRELSQQRVADRVGMSRENYGRIENGKIPYDQDILEMAADALNCSTADLLERDPIIEDAIYKLQKLLREATPMKRAQVLAVAETLLKTKD